MRLSLNRNQIKYIAIIAMVIDHIAWKFFPTSTAAGQIMHFFGRLTGPIMAIMVAEGYQYTRNLKKYMTRMAIFALISWVPYSLYESGHWPTLQFGVIYTLFLGLVAICVWDRTSLPKAVKVLITIGLCILSFFGDWPIFDVLWPLFLYLRCDDPKRKWMAFSIIAFVEAALTTVMAIAVGDPFEELFQWGVFLVLPLFLWCYNGEPGSRHPFHKWFFYVFYPLHLLVLYFVLATIS